MSGLAIGYHDIDPGKVAVVVTHLEMTAQAAPRGGALPAGVTCRRVGAPDVAWYRDLFLRVGGLDWLWASRLELPGAELLQVIANPAVEIWAVERAGRAEGLLELDFRTAGECEVLFFGLAAPLIGTGVGRWLMDHAIARAWAHPIARLHLHTCTADHPGALDFYRRSGFVATRRRIEVFDDPRLSGLLPPTAGPRIPLIAQ